MIHSVLRHPTSGEMLSRIDEQCKGTTSPTLRLGVSLCSDTTTCDSAVAWLIVISRLP